MKYYKIMTFENKIVGVVSSTDFVRFSIIANSYLRCNETNGEYVIYNGNTYRAAWMSPTKTDRAYTEVQILEISLEEYRIFIEAIEHEEEIIEEREEITPLPEPVDTIQAESLEFIRSSKLLEMSNECRKTIEAGFDLKLRGEKHHFSLDTQDQLNLISLSAMAQTQEYIPYHADGESCIFYTPEEINAIVSAATSYKVYHTTYYNALKTYINALDTIEAINKIYYGIEIPEEYQSDVLKALMQ